VTLLDKALDLLPADGDARARADAFAAQLYALVEAGQVERAISSGELLGGRRLVIKAVDQHFVEASPGRLSGVFPVIVTHPDPLPALRPSIPVIVQEYVDHESELRVYYVDGEVLEFDVRKESPADLWLASDRVEIRPVDPPGPVVAATRHLAAGLGLRFGALDFLLRGGDPVFLEVNPDGDWRWAEQKSATGQVTMAVARMLRRLHLDARDDRPAGSFNLLRFLVSGIPQPTPCSP
jgi:hypothetical protein